MAEEPTSPEQSPAAPVLTWTTLEHIHRDRSYEWYVVVGIIGAAAAISAFLIGNLLLGIFLLLATVILLFTDRQNPAEVEVRIGPRGVRYGEVFYPYETLYSFWIEEEYNHPRLIIKSNRILMPYIIILLPDDVDGEMLTTIMLSHLPGEELHENFLQQLLERFGF